MRAILDAHAEEQRREADAILSNLTPYEEEFIKNEVNGPRVQALEILLLRRAQNTARVYGSELPLSTVEELRYHRAVREEIDRLSGGNGSEIERRYGVEWNRLKAIAEKNLRGKKK